MDAPPQIGPFRVVSAIARGGGGQVYRVAHPEGGPDLALKLLLNKPSPRSLRRFKTEVDAMLRLQHKGVVGLRAAGEHGGLPYLVMDLVEGSSLQALLDRSGALPWREAANLGLQLAEALAECHAQGVVHRDLKPDNVLVDANRTPKIVDFGLALDLDAEQSRLTQSGTFMGTPGYWAPEQAGGKTEALGPLVDVYGIGAVLYAALTRFPPFRSSSVNEAITQTLHTAPDPPRTYTPDVPEAIERICMRCLEKEPAQRFPSAHAVAVALREALHGPPPAPPRSVAPLALVLLGLAAALGLGAWAVLGGDGEPAPRPPVAEPPPAAKPPPLEPSLSPAELAAELLAKEDYVGALPLLDEALVLDPSDVRTRVKRSFARRQLKDYSGSLEDLDEVLATHPENAEAWYQRGATLRKTREDMRALSDLNKALALDPSLARAYYHRGVIYGRQKNFVLALQDLDDALRLEPDVGFMLYHRARIHYKLKDLEQALTDVNRSLELGPRDLASRLLRATFYEELGRHALALEDLDFAISTYPDMAEAYYRRGFLHCELADRPSGLTDLRRGLELDPTYERAAEAQALLAE